MARKLKIKKLQINLTNRWLYTLIVFFSLITIGIGVYAAVGTTPNPGHPITELQPCDTAGEILKSDGTTWTCGTDNVGSSGLWNQYASGIYYDGGDINIYDNTNPNLNFGDAFGNSLKAGIQLQVAEKFLDIGDYMAETDDIGIRFWTNDAERMRIDKDGNVGITGAVAANAFIGDGSGLMNIIVKVTATNDDCSENNDGLLRYRSSYCSGDDERSSSLGVCMRAGDSSYSWYVLKTSVWTDASCDIDGCPPGETYYECWWEAEPGCYAYEPAGCYWSCFLSGTKVLMADGNYKEIQDIQSGNFVVSYDLINNAPAVSRVEQLLIHPDTGDGYLIVNNKLKVTANHRMWVVNRQLWQQMRFINIGDILLDSDGKEVIIYSIDEVKGTNTVYNLQLEGDYNNYFAEDILVHNIKLDGDFLP